MESCLNKVAKLKGEGWRFQHRFFPIKIAIFLTPPPVAASEFK